MKFNVQNSKFKMQNLEFGQSMSKIEMWAKALIVPL